MGAAAMMERLGNGNWRARPTGNAHRGALPGTYANIRMKFAVQMRYSVSGRRWAPFNSPPFMCYVWVHYCVNRGSAVWVLNCRRAS